MAVRNIKKYKNRKLYDKKQSKYVTLTEIADLAANGEELLLVTNGSGKDITKEILFDAMALKMRGQLSVAYLLMMLKLNDTPGPTITIDSLTDPKEKITDFGPIEDKDAVVENINLLDQLASMD